ncbi:MAG: glycosyltransferase family 4 protein [Candidatus Omnitrophica bacterium]|nr:glycosyltransferase family 4 protein [Candidatus Omnitrophota bacterium]
MKKIAFVCNVAYPFYIFRLGAMRRLSKEYQIYCIASADGRVDDLRREGFKFVNVDIERKGVNPFRDLRLLLRLYKIYKKEKFSYIFHYSIKPNIYGSIAAAMAGICSFSVITGLGYAFSEKNLVSLVVKILYKFVLIFPKKIFFLNNDDRDVFIKNKLVSPDKTFTLPSEGVDTDFYAPVLQVKASKSQFVFLFAGRFLWDKGVGDLVEAIKSVKEIYPQAELWLLGMIDKGNPRGIPEDVIHSWEQDGIIKYLGETNDVRSFIAQSDVAVYPSYYQEGVPRFLLESMSMEKPIITTDSVGCKEVIEDGKNGIMIKPKSVDSLVKAMMRMVGLSEQERIDMGKYGRQKAVQEFAEEKVIRIYLKTVSDCAKEGGILK